MAVLSWRMLAVRMALATTPEAIDAYRDQVQDKLADEETRKPVPTAPKYPAAQADMARVEAITNGSRNTTQENRLQDILHAASDVPAFQAESHVAAAEKRARGSRTWTEEQKAALREKLAAKRAARIIVHPGAKTAAVLGPGAHDLPVDDASTEDDDA